MEKKKFGMNYGAILGLILVLISVLIYGLGTLDFEIPGIIFTINSLVVLSFLLFSVTLYRDVFKGGFISYSESVKAYVTITVFSSFVFGLWRIIFIMFINPEYVELYIQHTQQQLLANAVAMEEIGFNVDDLLLEVESSDEKFTPFWIMSEQITKKAFGGLLIGLVISFFIKKEDQNLIV